MKQKTNNAPAAVTPQVIHPKDTHTTCYLIGLVMLVFSVAAMFKVWDVAREQFVKEQQENNLLASQAEWVRSQFPGYLKEADFSNEPIQPFMVKLRSDLSIGIKFGLAPDGTVVWRNHDETRAVEFYSLQWGAERLSPDIHFIYEASTNWSFDLSPSVNIHGESVLDAPHSPNTTDPFSCFQR